jgi:hypothetical protein
MTATHTATAAEVLLRHWAAQWRAAVPALSVVEHPDHGARAWAQRKLDELEDDPTADMLWPALDTIVHALARLDPIRVAEILEASAADVERA